MEQEFTLPIPYKGRILEQDFVFRKLGYTYKIFTHIDGQVLVFEPDEEGSFRGALYAPFDKGAAAGSTDRDRDTDSYGYANEVHSDQAPYYTADERKGHPGLSAGPRRQGDMPLDRGFIQAIIEVLTKEFK